MADHRSCPACGGAIDGDLTHCRHCGVVLDDDFSPRSMSFDLGDDGLDDRPRAPRAPRAPLVVAAVAACFVSLITVSILRLGDLSPFPAAFGPGAYTFYLSYTADDVIETIRTGAYSIAVRVSSLLVALDIVGPGERLVSMFLMLLLVGCVVFGHEAHRLRADGADDGSVDDVTE